eukprot:CAMPEP_0173398102 /NCGR_PEP_ID=MMETSP1356-20130122/40509_1 /TAXON_ID=77927 ORGANISM="Hemiselmis virescens, Strain PCC157" /NCGR_SAMPLE_ID=MMETSP1356 /ASSEMBLY_ACC=CAM_ASM_000847 /LENGTH=45 /DNA_ID= /DNA_START= /DNA_END= /DNA_ORIENTATION=
MVPFGASAATHTALAAAKEFPTITTRRNPSPSMSSRTSLAVSRGP